MLFAEIVQKQRLNKRVEILARISGKSIIRFLVMDQGNLLNGNLDSGSTHCR